MAGPTLQDLGLLSAVAERRSFRAAAADLGLSPSSLSHTLASVERRLGVRLFNRTTRSVALTEAGEQFLARARPALREIGDAVDGVNRFRDTPTGLLRLNASEGGAERILPTVLSFLAACPDMRVDLVSDGRLVDIVAEGFDAGVRGAGAAPQDMVALPLGQAERFLLVASPDYLAVQAAVAGAGVACVIERAISDELASGQLTAMLEDWTPPFEGVSLYYPRQRLHSAGLAAFIAHFKAERRRAARPA